MRFVLSLLAMLFPTLCLAQSLPSPSVTTRPANDNSNHAASTGYVDNALTGKVTQQTSSLTVNVAFGGASTAIQAGIDSCAALALSRTAICTVQIAAGTYTPSATLTLAGPYADRVKIQGASPTTTSISAIGTVTGSDKNYTVTLTVGSSAGITVGSYVVVTGTIGTAGHQVHQGTYKVLTVPDSTHLTVLNTASNGTPPTGVTGTLTFYPTQLRFPGKSGVVASALGGLANVVITGDGTAATFGIWSKDSSTLQPGAVTIGPLGVSGFVDNVRANYGGVIHGTGVVSSSATNNGGQARDKGMLSCASCVFTSNGTAAPGGGGNGILSQNASAVYMTAPTLWGNALAGGYARSAASMLVDTAAPGSAGRNVMGWYGGALGFLQAEGSSSDYNSQFGWASDTQSLVVAISGTASGNGVNNYMARLRGSMDAGNAVSTASGSNGFAAIGPGGSYLNATGSNVVSAGSTPYIADDGGDLVITGAAGLTSSFAGTTGRGGKIVP